MFVVKITQLFIEKRLCLGGTWAKSFGTMSSPYCSEAADMAIV